MKARRIRLDNQIVGTTTLFAVGLRVIRRNAAVVALLFCLLVIALICTP